jgi:hypothetical protein
MFEKFYPKNYFDEKKIVKEKILVNLKLKIDEMTQIENCKSEHNPSLKNNILQKKIILNSLKSYYNL